MKQITIKSIKLTNFKGISALTIPFNQAGLDIYGDNASGKTTIVDAFNWCLFGKDSQDRKDFAIRPIDANGIQDNKTESEVEVELVVENTFYKLRRVFAGNFVKKRGSNVEEFQGNETRYYIDEVPHKQKEYDLRIATFCDEQLFKLLSIAGRFFLLDWKQQREILNKLAQIGTDADIIQTLPEATKYLKLIEVLNANKTLEMYRKQLSAERLAIKKEIDDIGPRIAELKSIPAPEKIEINKAEIEELIAQENELIQSANNLFSASQSEINNKIAGFQKQISDLQTKRLNLIADAKNEGNIKYKEHQQRIQLLKNQISINNDNYLLHNRKITEDKARLEKLEEERQSLVESWNQTKSSVYALRKFEPGVCPCCNRANEYSEKAQAEFETQENLNADNFMKVKVNILNEIETQGEKVNNQIDELKKEIQLDEANIQQYQIEIDKLQAELDFLDRHNVQPFELTDEKSVAGVLDIDEDIEALKVLIEATEQERGQEPNIELNKQAIEKLNAQLAECITHEARVNEYNKTAKRIDELLFREQELCNKMATIEKDEYLIDEFNSVKIDLVSSKVNSMFKFVKFKMFNHLINGGIEETCEAMVEGVTISNVNNAGRINAGLDIIGTLSEFYSISVPCFIDNAESITKIIPFDSQLIKLIVSEIDKKLTY